METARADNPLVTVIIAAYDSPDYLNQALESVTRQTFLDYEIIVVDDCSPKESVSRYKLPEGARLILRTERYGAAGASRNEGIAEARGKYIALLDQDDVWLPQKLAAQVEALENHPDAGVTFCHCSAVDSLLNPLHKKWRIRSHARGALKRMIRGSFIKTPSSVLIRRAVFDECGTFDLSLRGASDWDMWLRIARVFQFVAIPEALVLYRMHPAQLSRQRKPMQAAKIKIYEKTLEWARAECPGMVNTVKRCYCRVLRQISFNEAVREKDAVAAQQTIRRAIRLWPWSPQTYGMLLRLMLRSRFGGRDSES